jgi:hypothetical protein
MVFFFGFMRFRRKRLIQNIPTTTIRGMAIGLVAVSVLQGVIERTLSLFPQSLSAFNGSNPGLEEAKKE